MKCCNLAAFDPALKQRGIKGLAKASQLDGEVWIAFEDNPERIGYESEIAYSNFVGRKPRAVKVIEWEDVQGLDKWAVTKVRVNQHLFRSIVLAGYQNECAVCRIPLPKLLVASHILPWAVATDERMNPRNGICLCAIHDKAFECGYLLISEEYQISFSAIIEKLRDNSAVSRHLLGYAGERIRLPDRWHPDPNLLARRRELSTLGS
jgi:putative restriction endonuclease